MSKKTNVINHPKVPNCRIIREETDPLAIRLSIGGTKAAGNYLVFRADDPKEALKILQEATESFQIWIKAHKND